MEQLDNFKKKLRKNLTIPERILWAHLRSSQCEGLKFRRQVEIGPYIVDFLCLDRKLVIEVDGDDHADKIEKDRKRTAYLEELGYIVKRYNNRDVLKNLDGVIVNILERP